MDLRAKSKAKAIMQLRIVTFFLILIALALGALAYVQKKSNESLSGQVDVANSAANQAKMTNDELHRELNVKTEESEALKSELDEARKEIADLNSTVSALSGQVKSLTATIEASQGDEEEGESKSSDSSNSSSKKSSSSSSDKTDSSSKKSSSSSDKSSSSSQKEEPEALAPAPEQPPAPAPAPAAGGHSFTDKTGASTVFTNDEWNYLQSVWAYTGEADEMISHHTIGELRTVLNAR